jgi:hypothetical protein
LERLNRLLVAEELRIRIAIVRRIRHRRVGFFFLPWGFNWPPLRHQFIKADQVQPLEGKSFDDFPDPVGKKAIMFSFCALLNNSIW